MECMIFPVVLVCHVCGKQVNSYARFSDTFNRARMIPVLPDGWRQGNGLRCDNNDCIDKSGYTNPSTTYYGKPHQCKHCKKMPVDHANGQCLFGSTQYEPDFMACLLEKDA